MAGWHGSNSGRCATTRPFRWIAALAAALVFLPMLTFACGIIAAGFDEPAVGTVLNVGLGGVALTAIALLLAAILAATVRRSKPTWPRGRR